MDRRVPLGLLVVSLSMGGCLPGRVGLRPEKSEPLSALSESVQPATAEAAAARSSSSTTFRADTDPIAPQPPPAADPANAAPLSTTQAPRDPAVRRTGLDGAQIRSTLDPSAGEPAAPAAARVGDTVITLRELKNAIRDRVKDAGSFDQLPKEQRNEIARSVLDNLIDRTLIVQAARREIKNAKQWDMLTDYAEKAWREKELPPLLRRFHVEGEFELKQKLAETKESLDDMRESFKLDTMSREILMGKIRPRVEMPGLPEMRAYYQQHLADFDRPAGVTWREVLIPIAANTDKAAARRRAETVRNRLLKGEDFATIAKTESAGASAAKGGSWEWTTPGGYAVIEVNQALETLATGSISPVIEAATGCHIVRVEARRPAGPAPFVEVQKTIADALFQQNLDREMKAYLAKLRQRALITSPLFDGTASAPTHSAGSRSVAHDSTP